MLSEAQLAQLTLSLTPGLNGNALRQVIRSKHDPALILRGTAGDLRYFTGITAQQAAVLYVRGSTAVLSDEVPLVALVGTRRGSTAGLEFAFTLAAELAAAGDAHTLGSVSLLVAGAAPLTGTGVVLTELKLERASTMLAALSGELQSWCCCWPGWVRSRSTRCMSTAHLPCNSCWPP